MIVCESSDAGLSLIRVSGDLRAEKMRQPLSELRRNKVAEQTQ
jgi:hypothetical protein